MRLTLALCLDVWIGALLCSCVPPLAPQTDAGVPCVAKSDASSAGKFSSLATGRNPMGLATGDFNGDGWADLVAANQLDSSISVFLADGPGRFAGEVVYRSGGTTSVATADLNGDGLSDVLVGPDALTVFLAGPGGALSMAGLYEGKASAIE